MHMEGRIPMYMGGKSTNVHGRKEDQCTWEVRGSMYMGGRIPMYMGGKSTNAHGR